MTVAIVGGGLMGVSLAYYLSRQGVAVEVFEASPELGGLAGSLQLEDGAVVDGGFKGFGGMVIGCGFHGRFIRIFMPRIYPSGIETSICRIGRPDSVSLR